MSPLNRQVVVASEAKHSQKLGIASLLPILVAIAINSTSDWLLISVDLRRARLDLGQEFPGQPVELRWLLKVGGVGRSGNDLQP